MFNVQIYEYRHQSVSIPSVVIIYNKKHGAREVQKGQPIDEPPIKGYTMAWAYISVNPSSCGDSGMRGPSGAGFSSSNLKSGCEYLVPR